MPEDSTGFHQISWTERVENDLRALWPLLQENPDDPSINHSDIWTGAQRLAKDFEATHQVVKQPRLDDDSMGLYRFIGGNTL